jgi:hypothetical protein
MKNIKFKKNILLGFLVAETLVSLASYKTNAVVLVDLNPDQLSPVINQGGTIGTMPAAASCPVEGQKDFYSFKIEKNEKGINKNRDCNDLFKNICDSKRLNDKSFFEKFEKAGDETQILQTECEELKNDLKSSVFKGQNNSIDLSAKNCKELKEDKFYLPNDWLEYGEKGEFWHNELKGQ